MRGFSDAGGDWGEGADLAVTMPAMGAVGGGLGADGSESRPYRGMKRGFAGGDHAGDGAGGVGEDGAGDAVEAGDVDDGGHHREVARADVGRDLAAREG